jgi:DNA repair exonuclease SbcCD ATPase subunit
MRLISVELENVCQFRYQKVDFAPGLTAVIGRNGGGKSNLMKSVYAAISGDFGRNDGLKTDNICQYAKPTDTSKITSVLEHGGTTIEIVRSLRPVGTRLRLSSPGMPPVLITKAQEASDVISNMLGVSSRMLSDYVFVDQWSIFDFLSMMPAERAKAFQRLFRTESAEALWKILGEHHDKLVIPTPGIDKDVVTRRITENEEKYDSLSTEYASCKNQISTSDPRRDRKVCEDWNNKKSAQVRAKDLDTKQNTYGEECRQIDIKRNVLARELDAFRGYVTEHNDRNMSARKLLGAWAAHERLELQRSEVESRRALTLEDFMRGSSEPVRPAEYVSPRGDRLPITQFWRDYEAAKKRVTVGEHFMALLTINDPHCPTCGTPRCTFETHRADYEKQIEQDRSDLARMQIVIDGSASYDQAARAFTERNKYYGQIFRSLDEQLQMFTDIPKPDRPKHELEAEITEFADMERMLHQTQNELARLDGSYEQKQETLAQLARELQELQKVIQETTVTEVEAAQAQGRLDIHNELLQKEATLKGNLVVLEKALRDDRMCLAQLESIERQAHTERKWGEYSLDMRHLVHRDNLPRAVAQNYLDLMQDEINALLVRFDSPFTVATDDTLSFNATFKDGRRVPASRLSGGEKVLLALAFRVVVNDIFAKDLGLLCLDEPTAGLDDGNLSCLRIAIERLKELSSSRGLQVIMITHEKELAYLFDNVIEVGKD